jgi:hypothetical protein
MSYATRAAALASLREFSPITRQRHHIVRFWSSAFNTYRFARVFR